MTVHHKLSGNEAVAIGMRQINPNVVAAYLTTPSTDIPRYFSSFVEKGQVDTEFIAVESEASVMSACIGAAAAGTRTMVATSANGLGLMWNILHATASSRLPIIMSVVNGILLDPVDIHNNHSDSMGARDCGWIQLYGENTQEAYDNAIMGVRIGEHQDVELPVMNCFDDFITSNDVEDIDFIEDEKVKAFVGEYQLEHCLLSSKKHNYSQVEGMRNAKKVILEIAEEFEKLTGRKYGLFEAYKMEDAELAIVVLGSTAGTTKHVVNELRSKGVKAGLIKIRVFRPFPAEEIADVLSGCKAVAVLDKTDGFNGKGAPVFNEVRSALYDIERRPAIVNYIYGLGARNVLTNDIERVYDDLAEIVVSRVVGDVYRYLGAEDHEEIS